MTAENARAVAYVKCPTCARGPTFWCLFYTPAGLKALEVPHEARTAEYAEGRGLLYPDKDTFDPALPFVWRECAAGNHAKCPGDHDPAWVAAHRCGPCSCACHGDVVHKSLFTASVDDLLG